MRLFKQFYKYSRLTVSAVEDEMRLQEINISKHCSILVSFNFESKDTDGVKHERDFVNGYLNRHRSNILLMMVIIHLRIVFLNCSFSSSSMLRSLQGGFNSKI